MHAISSRWCPEKKRPSKRRRQLQAILASIQERRKRKVEKFSQQIKETLAVATPTNSENFSNDRFGHCIIKEELILSEESDDELKYDVENCNSDNVEKYLISDLRDSAVSQNEEDIFSEIRVKTEEQPKQESPNTSTHIRSTKEIDEDVVKVLKEHCKTYCPKCKKKKPVIFRKPKCMTCKTRLTCSCEKCQKSYISYTELCYHIKLKHIGLPYELVRPNDGNSSCSKCDRTFMRVQSKNKHEIGCGIEPRFNCTHCPYKSSYKRLLLSHLLMHKKKKAQMVWLCLKCGKNYTSERSLRRHRSVYCDKKKLVQCAHCERKVYRKDELIHHLRIRHSLPN